MTGTSREGEEEGKVREREEGRDYCDGGWEGEEGLRKSDLLMKGRMC